MFPIKLYHGSVRLLTLLLALLPTGCTTIKLVGDYDEQIDKGATALHRQIETFFVELESQSPRPESRVEPYAMHKQFYADTKVAISTLRLRADATERNSLTVRMLDKIAENLRRLEEMHSSPEGLSRAELIVLRGAFTTQFTALLTFELAKKRGETPNDVMASADPTQPSTAK